MNTFQIQARVILQRATWSCAEGRPTFQVTADNAETALHIAVKVIGASDMQYIAVPGQTALRSIHMTCLDMKTFDVYSGTYEQVDGEHVLHNVHKLEPA